MPIATDPLSLVFIASFLFGLLFLVAAALLGSFGHGTAHSVHGGTHTEDTHVGTGHNMHLIHNISHVDKGAITKTSSTANNNFSLFAYTNPTTVALFLLGFGFFGYVFHDTVGFVLPLTFVLAVVSGIIVAGLLLAMLSRVFGDSEAETIQDVSDRTGLLGKVSITIQENGIGEVLYVSPGGMRKSIPARSVDGRRLERGQEVVVINYQNGFAEVDTWDNFVNSTDHEGVPSDAVPNKDEMTALRTLLEESEKKDTQFVMRKDTQKE
ncbi:MAG: hypothetical protein NVS4B12_01440 [Ktedonobacteraceae bacterium]